MDSARKTWGDHPFARSRDLSLTDTHDSELENAVKLVDPDRDALYTFDRASQASIRAARPWRQDPHHFKAVRISAVALLKMTMHARSGGEIEVMGLMVGKIEHETFVVSDAFRLPVEGTETRVNAHQEAIEYMSAFDQKSRDAGRPETVVGWYHSHPGYGCWLSGIDVGTQSTWQMYEDPFVAVVVDPDRTISAGKVEIGAFRCYPEGYAPPDAGARGGDVGHAAVPMAKVADFGAHANRYYPLEVSHYKSGLDAVMLESLWNKYWVQTLGASPLLTNRDYGTKQIGDLAEQVVQVTASWKYYRSAGGSRGNAPTGAPDPAMEKVVRAAEKIAAEEKTGLLTAEIKKALFVSKVGQVHGARGVVKEDSSMHMQDVKSG